MATSMQFGPEWMRKAPKAASANSADHPTPAAPAGRHPSGDSTSSSRVAGLPGLSLSGPSPAVASSALLSPGVTSYSSVVAHSADGERGGSTGANGVHSAAGGHAGSSATESPFRYTRDLMLSIYSNEKVAKLPLEFEKHKYVTNEEPLVPFGLQEMSDAEVKLFSGPLNSEVNRRQPPNANAPDRSHTHPGTHHHSHHHENVGGERGSHRSDRGGGAAGDRSGFLPRTSTGPGGALASPGRERFGGITGGVLSGVGPQRKRKDSEPGQEFRRASRTSEHVSSPTPSEEPSIPGGSSGGWPRGLANSQDGSGGRFRPKSGNLVGGREADAPEGWGPRFRRGSDRGANVNDSEGLSSKFPGYEKKRERQGNWANFDSWSRRGPSGAISAGAVGQPDDTNAGAREDGPTSALAEQPSQRPLASEHQPIDGIQEEAQVEREEDHDREQSLQQNADPDLSHHVTSVLGSLALDDEADPVHDSMLSTSAPAEESRPDSSPWSPDRQMWFYRDPSGQVQGPFNAISMQEWYRQSYFTDDLMVKPQEAADFAPLGEVIRAIGDVVNPFLVPSPSSLALRYSSAAAASHSPLSRLPPSSQPSQLDFIGNRAPSGGMDFGRSAAALAGGNFVQQPGFGFPFSGGLSRGWGVDAGAVSGGMPSENVDVAAALSARAWPGVDLGLGGPHSPNLFGQPGLSGAYGGPDRNVFEQQRLERLKQEEYIHLLRQRELQEQRQAQAVAVAAAVSKGGFPSDALAGLPLEGVRRQLSSSSLGPVSPFFETFGSRTPVSTAPWSHQPAQSGVQDPAVQAEAQLSQAQSPWRGGLLGENGQTIPAMEITSQPQQQAGTPAAPHPDPVGTPRRGTPAGTPAPSSPIAVPAQTTEETLHAEEASVEQKDSRPDAHEVWPQSPEQPAVFASAPEGQVMQTGLEAPAGKAAPIAGQKGSAPKKAATAAQPPLTPTGRKGQAHATQGQSTAPSAAGGKVNVVSPAQFNKRPEEQTTAISVPISSLIHPTSAAEAAVSTPVSASKLAPWAKDDAERPATPSGPSLREIQEAEAHEAEARKAAERERLAAMSKPTSSGVDTALPTTQSWGLASVPVTGAATTSTSSTAASASPAWQKTAAAPKKTLAEIQEEERKRAQKAKEQQAHLQGAVIGRKGYADSASRVSSPAASTAAAAVAGAAGSGWSIVGSGGKATNPSSAATGPAAGMMRQPSAGAWSTAGAAKSNGVIAGSTASAQQKPASKVKSAPNAPKPAAVDPNAPVPPSAEFIRHCKESLKGLTGVNVDEFIQMLLSFPLDPSPTVMEIISDSVYANSSTLDGRRFAADFVAKRKADAAAVRAAATNGASVSGGKSSSVGGARTLSDVVKQQPKPAAANDWGFKVVNKKKGKR